MKEKLFKHTGRINTSITDSEKHAELAELLKSRRQFRMSTAANSTPFQNIMAVYVGHDHKNNFIGTYKNVDLGFTPSSGFNAYGNRTKRGVRCFILDEKEPDSYKTYSRTYEDLVGKKVSRPVFDYLSSKAPTTVDAAIPMIVKTIGIIAAIIILIILLAKFL